MYLGIDTADPRIVWKIIPSKTRNMQFADKITSKFTENCTIARISIYCEHHYVNFLVKFFKTAL